jgi:hypothetical protein
MASTQLSSQQVRDALVECFVDAQFQKIEASAERLGLAKDRAQVRTMIEYQVKEAFSRVGASYDTPKKGDFADVMEILARKALSMGESPLVIDAHRKQIQALVDQMRD